MTVEFPAIPSTQALQSTTFRPPPLDGTLTLPEIYDWHANNTPHHRVFVLSDDVGKTRSIYWPELVHAVYNGTLLLSNVIENPVAYTKTPIVAILAASDNVTYFTMIMAILRAGYIAFPISPRNSSAAVAHLLQSVGVDYILVSSDQATKDLANDSINAFKQTSSTVSAVPQLLSMPHFDEIFRDPSSACTVTPLPKKQRNEIAIFLHSSGSTAYPKPIALTHKRCLEWALTPYFGERDLTDIVLSINSIPMCHGIGFLQCCWTATCGLVIGDFHPKSTARMPTVDNLYRSVVAIQSDLILCVPSIIEAWAQNIKYVEWLGNRHGGVLYGGGPLNKTIGDFLTSKGVSIYILYGATEAGTMSTVLPAHVGYDWEYFKFPDKFVTAEMVPNQNNTFELVVVSNEFCHPSVINTKVMGAAAYATSDLLTPHLTKPGYWKVYGRADDQIMHSTGEKTNPGPLETILNQDPHVRSAVIFGRGKFQAGVLIDPKPEYSFDPENEEQLGAFRNMIWPTVQKMNKYAPQQSRIFKEMILVAKPKKSLQYTAKGTARRQAIIRDYEDEIEGLFLTVEATAQSNLTLPDTWDLASVTNFVRKVVGSVLVSEVHDNDDLFQHGCDSLQATWIRNSLARALRKSPKRQMRHDADNFVYDYPSVNKLAEFITTTATGDDTERNSIETRRQAIEHMVDIYTADLKEHIPRRDGGPSSNRIVLLTGSTGGLGTFILAQLVNDADVERVYCINRPSGGPSGLMERQRESLLTKSLPVEIVDSKKVNLIEARLDDVHFGLRTSVYDEMHSSVTHIIHNAWPVNFNLALSSFEPNIKGLRNLIDFALSSQHHRPPTIVYTSSVGIFQNPGAFSDGLPESAVDPEVAVGTGYTESKWVCEQILSVASEKTALRSVTVRVGQICGGHNGFWNTKEWFPALVQSANFVRCIPIVDKSVSWLPPNVVAASLIEFLQATESGIVHLVHPRPLHWSKISQVLSEDLGVPLVPYEEWLSRVEDLPTRKEVKMTSTSAPVALRLLSFYRDIGLKMQSSGSSSEAFGLASLATERATSMSRVLAESEQLEERDVKSWLGYWRSVDFL